MRKSIPVITGLGIVSPNAIGREEFWQAIEQGKSGIKPLSLFSAEKFFVKIAGEVKDFNPKQYLGDKGLRNLDRSALLLLVAAKEALEHAAFKINDETTDIAGVCTGTTFAHFGPIAEFDKEVFQEGLDFSNPSLFPSTVINAPSCQVSIRFNIQGFNTTVSTGYTSSLEALSYSVNALEMDKAEFVLSAAVDSLVFPVFFGFHKLGYMAGVNGPALSCPFDARRNGPVISEGAAVLAVEDEERAAARGVPILAKIRSVAARFEPCKIGKIDPQGKGLEAVIRQALSQASVAIDDIDYISSCANSSADLDRIECAVLKNIFGKKLADIPVSSVKSMIGETFSPAGNFQIASVLGAMRSGNVPPTINHKEQDPSCAIDCVPNESRRTNVRAALVTSFGPGGYNAACVLEKPE